MPFQLIFLFIIYIIQFKGNNLYYNSVCIVSPEGDIKNYQKHFLYTQDEKWAEEGPSFRTYDFPELGEYRKVFF